MRLADLRGSGGRRQDRADLLLLVVVFAANPTQVFVVPQAWQFLTQPLFAALALALVLRSGATLRDVGLERRALGAGLRWGLIAAGVILAALAVTWAVPDGRELLDDPAVVTSSTADLLHETLLRIPVVTAGPEEVLFRGAVLAAAVRRWGALPGALASSLLFGLWHLSPTLNDGSFASVWAGVGAAVGAVAFTFAAGLVFVWLRRRSGSLLAPFLAHWAANALGLAAVHLASH